MAKMKKGEHPREASWLIIQEKRTQNQCSRNSKNTKAGEALAGKSRDCKLARVKWRGQVKGRELRK